MTELPMRTGRSPQADLLDKMIWSNLSQFWSESMPPQDRDGLNAVYEAFMHALDAEYIRLFEISAAKGILTCPLYSQRRWLRLDLNNSAEQQAFLSYLAQATAGQSSVQTKTAGDVLDCTVGATNHARHWHISFPWQVTADEASRVVKLGFPSSFALINIYRMSSRPDGTTRGRLITPGRDYELLGSGTAIRFLRASINEKFEISAGIDVTGHNFDGYRPVVHRVTTVLQPNVLQVPPDFATGFPVHVMVVRDAAAPGEDVLTTNTDRYSTRREFYPFTGDGYTGAAYSSLGSVVIPPEHGLGVRDVAFVFALVKGEANTFHSHLTSSRVLSVANAEPLGTATFTPDLSVSLGLSGSVAMLGQILQMFVDGELLSPDDYVYDHPSNTFTFKQPITFPPTGNATVDMFFDDQQILPVDSSANMHQHRLCVQETVKTPEVPATLDDGGDFDDPLDETGRFDDYIATNVVRLAEQNINVNDLLVYKDGELEHAGSDFRAVEKNGVISLAFARDIGGTVIQVEYQRAALTYSYGDIGSVTVTPESLSAFMDHLTDYLTAFHTQFGSSNLTTQQLLAAAQIAAAGGNPFLALFYDEASAEFANMPLDAPNQYLTAQQARTLESTNTNVIAIPYLVDHVCNPTVRLQQGHDYELIRGTLQSVRDLTAPRGPQDEAPGVWWCPLVVLDEHMLAKNFGALLGTMGDSSTAYRNQLITELMLRYNGPQIQALQNAASAGSDIFTQAGTVQSATKKVTGYTVTLVNAKGDQHAVFSVSPTTALPAQGNAVFPGQTATAPLLSQMTLVNLVNWTGNALTVTEDLVHLAGGDQVRIELYDANSDIPTLTELTVDSVKTRKVGAGVESTVAFRQAKKRAPRVTSGFWAFRPAGQPYAPFRGSVASVAPIIQVAIATEAETLFLNEGEETVYKKGDPIVPGSPLRPNRALVYDAQQRPNWHWITPAHDRHFWSALIPAAKVTSQEDRRYISLSATTNGLVTGVLGVIEPIPARGTKVVVTEDQTGDLLEFVVVGADDTGVRLKAQRDLVLAKPTSGVALLTNPAATREYFEIEPTHRNGERPSSILANRHRLGDAALYLSSIAGFPDAGRAILGLPNGGAVEIEYDGASQGRLLNCRWPDNAESLRETSTDPADPGAIDPIIEAGLKVTAVAAYTTEILNPAFIALVKQRVVRDYSTFNGSADLTAASADEYYKLLSPTATVIETSLNDRPSALATAIKDVSPAGTSTLMFSRHVVADTLDMSPSDAARRYHPLEITVRLDGALPVSGAFHLPASAWSALATATVVDADNLVPHMLQWVVAPIRFPGGVAVSAPDGLSTKITGLTPGNEYAITFSVKTATGRTESVKLALLVAE